MFDPSLPPPFPIVEDDLVYVITGYNKINCLPDSRESSIQNLRRYLVQISGVSGIGVRNIDGFPFIYSTAQEDNLIDINYSSSYPYYQSIATTGLNARIGNNMEIQFATGTPAANKYGGVGGKYFSGIISTTGLNTKTENLIVRDFESIWPYSGIIYNTGLNARVGNNMEIQFTTGTPAANLYGGVGGKYLSGIVSTTGLNARTENLIVRDFETIWPYSGVIYNTGLNAVVGNNMEVQFYSGTPAADRYGRVGGKYVSGIISTTGLNARTENLIVRDFESLWPYSGVIYNTGLNAVIGNNMEIQFYSGTPAANKYGRVGGKYISGIISTTGLNARTENLIVRDFETTWPYSGVIYNTGLNARAGNLIEIQYKTSSPAGGLYGGTEVKYWSGIISTTGLNIVDGKNIAYTIDNSFPYKYTIFTVDKAVIATGSITYSNNNISSNGYSSNVISYTDTSLLIDYSILYTSKTNETIDLISTFKFLLPENNVEFYVPFAGYDGTLSRGNTRAELEAIGGILNTPWVGIVSGCPGPGTTSPACQAYTYSDNTLPLTSPANSYDLQYWEPIELKIIAGSFEFTISCTGGASSVFAKYPVVFTNLGTGIPNPSGGISYQFGSNLIYEKYRSSTNSSHKYAINNVDPMEIEYFQQLLINSNSMNSQNSIAPLVNISNFGYTRTYRKKIGMQYPCEPDCTTPFYLYPQPVYRYVTYTGYNQSAFSIGQRSFKTKNV